jgi:hypothetical protein
MSVLEKGFELAQAGVESEGKKDFKKASQYYAAAAACFEQTVNAKVFPDGDERISLLEEKVKEYTQKAKIMLLPQLPKTELKEGKPSDEVEKEEAREGLSLEERFAKLKENSGMLTKGSGNDLQSRMDKLKYGEDFKANNEAELNQRLDKMLDGKSNYPSVEQIQKDEHKKLGIAEYLDAVGNGEHEETFLFDSDNMDEAKIQQLMNEQLTAANLLLNSSSSLNDGNNDDEVNKVITQMYDELRLGIGPKDDGDEKEKNNNTDDSEEENDDSEDSDDESDSDDEGKKKKKKKGKRRFF